MSRGPGKIQRMILEALRGGPLSLTSLIWRVAEGGGVIAVDGDISGEVYGNIHRAAQRLALSGDVTVNDGRYDHFAQLEVTYPDLTKFGSVREIRRRCLPHVRAFLKVSKPRPGWSDAACEDHVMEVQASGNPREVRTAWIALEKVLFSAIGRVDEKAQRAYLRALARGRELFRRSPGCHCDFALISVLARLQDDPRPQVAKPSAALLSLLPRAAFRARRLKAQLYRVVSLRDRASLKRDFKEYLAGAEPSLLVAAPVRRQGRAGLTDLGRRREPRLVPALDKLILHDVFKTFSVYALSDA